MASLPALHDYLGVQPHSNLQLAELAEHGLPIENLAKLRARGFSNAEIGATVISARTLQHRRARGERLSPEETDRAIRVAGILSLADQVFGNPQKALLWLRTANPRLSARTPLSLLATETGGRLIEGMLHGIDEGIYS